MKPGVVASLFLAILVGMILLFALVFARNNSGNWGAFAGLAFIWFLLFVKAVAAANKKHKLKNVEMNKVSAVVLAKTTKVTGRHTRTTYHVSFEEIDKKIRRSFEVPMDRYNTLTEGDVGTLNYKVAPGHIQFFCFDRK